MNEDVTAVAGQFENAFGGGEVQQRQMKQHAATFAQSPVRPVTAGNDETTNPQKKIKLEIVPAADTSTSSGCLEDLSVLKRRILDHKYMRLRALKEKYSEHVAELFFLQTGGNMMEYPVWRKKPQAPQFITFSRQHRLDQSQLDDLAISSQSPLGTEVKIVGIGATPIAVSTQLPAAVAQLANQHGQNSGRPSGGRHGMVFGHVKPIIAPTIGVLVPGGTPLVPDADRRVRTDSAHINGVPSATNGPADQFSVKAKQEVYVMQRITELQREGLWSEKRLPKLQEPQRPKAHWDYLLEEMSWLAADFAQERKWKKAAAKKCARMVQKYFQDKAIAAQKAEKAQEMQLKRVAAMLAKEVKVFWSNVEKLVEFKQQTRLDEKRKKALDQQLSFIVDQTERYSQQLAVGMNKSVVERSSKANSLQSSRISSPQRSLGSDDEFKPTEDSSDDETTIAQAEKEAAGTSEEIAALQKESQMDLDDVIKQLPPNYLENREKIQLSEKGESSDSDVDKDFNADEPSDDDEDTIQEQEKTERNADHKKEIAELEADNELTVEQLRAKYGAGSPMELSDEGDSTPTDMSESEADKNEDADEVEEEEEEENDEDEEEEEEEEEEPAGLQSLLKEDQDNDELLNDAAAIAESIQPKGNTLSSTSVVTPIPFLLKHTLREYQHIGLDWLVTMHDRKLNGILADEMGLGKTIQTISLLGHLACEMGNWGPHLIIVPSSVMLNWEMEFKKWCPGFKILTYYGSQKERKLKRIGWTKANAFHVCITSYKLVIQDHQSFRRKKWKYLILDEAQNIKNFKSQRWQLLLNFQTEQRLLLTGTPLQNNLMELWSLMHFLMPHVFQSHREFKEWFSNPVTGMIEGNSEYNESIIKRLHKVLRPFLLRRLKSEVEKQMPKKYEHVLMCRLSKRQRYLYDDFMSRAKTRETLESGNLLSVINVLMQLRKVCNHPNLFETRQTVSPFRMDQIIYRTSSLVCDCLDYDPFQNVDLRSLNLLLVELEFCLTAYVAHRARKLAPARKLIEEIDSAAELPPPCPTTKVRMYVRIKNTRVSDTISSSGGVKVGTSPVMKGTQKSTAAALQSRSSLTKPLAAALVEQLKHHSYSTPDQSETQKEAADSTTPTTSEFYVAKIDETRKTHRSQALIQLARHNARCCDANPIYGEDLRTSFTNIDDVSSDAVPFITVGYGNCRKFLRARDWRFAKSVKTIEERTLEMKPVFDNFLLFVPAVCAPPPNIYISHHNPSKRLQEMNREEVIRHELSEKFTMLHPIVSAMSTKFPDPRLIQYDCGKLQTMDRLLKQLKDGGHRVLIFTQMTRMLDVLEAFLNYHGHIYLRLDGTTKVEQRQVYMERFNNDKRIFAFILSTRSGGVGVNLTGADTVIFYDSDWNPTMDAQAQDRCHRIGQTRDVHIYRLVSEKTIEENILKKANQKRLLGDLAIEGGNFTTAYFKSTTIQDLFHVDVNEEDASARLAEVVERAEEVAGTSKNAIGAFETALAQAEDDQDVQAAKTARDEAAAEMDEFDENIPIVEEVKEQELSKGEREIQGIISQLNPIEKYAMKFVEDTLETWTAVQLEAVEKEIEQQKRDWEANRLADLAREEEERKRMEVEENDIITYSRDDAKNQVWISILTEELMPMWCPPTPPQDDNDVYIDHSLGFLYEQQIIPEDQLPAIYIKREYKRSRLEGGFFTDGRRNLKARKEDHFYAPRSLFDRNATQMVKMRRDLKLQRFRNFYRSPVQIGGLKQQQNPVKQLNEPEGMAEWSIYEDMIILNIIENFQFLPTNLTLIHTGHTPNWDLVADMVNQTSRTYRSPKQCRYRYEAVIVPREEGKYIESPKKQKKNKMIKNSPMKSSRMRTSQLFSSDNNSSFSKYSRMKFDIMKNALMGKNQNTKQVLVNPSMKNPKHAAVLAEMGINTFEGPLTPQEIATKRVERITKEKQKSALQQSQEMSTVASTSSQPQVIQVQQPSSSQQTVQQIVVQQSAPVAALVQSNQIQVSRSQSAVVQSPQQIVKAIVSASPGQPLMTQQMLAERQQQLQQGSQGSMINPNSVSVVLSSPVTTVSNVQVGTPQIVSIGQSVVASSSAIVSQSGSIIQTITSQPSQVVSVAQLATIGVSGISTSTTQRAGTQRIVTASTLQEVVLQQRQAGSQSPTVVSVSNLTPSQLSAMRLNVTGQPGVPGVLATKTIPVVTAGAGKPGSQIFYRQPIRQQLKVMHSGGQTGLVGPGGIVTNIQNIQGQTVQMQGGQKVAVASGSGATTSVATVQMAGGQPRFVKPVGGKQLARQVGDGEMPTVMVKKPMIGHKQMLPQTQIYTQNVQVQQGSSNQPQVATLIKASAALTGPLSQVKAAQIKTQLNQVRQIQLHPQVQISQQRKGGKVTQIAQLGKAALPTQLIVNSKNLPGTVTVQQIQPVYRHANPGQLPSGQIMLGKSRMIPVSVAQQPNQRPTIQVVTGTPNVRAHVATTQNIQGVLQGAIKVAPPQQQAILTALQNSNQRSNASPVRLQTGGPLVAVTVQQSPQNSQSAQSTMQQDLPSGSSQGAQQQQK